MRQVVSDCPASSVTTLSRTIAELLEWRRPNGRVKNHECRLVLERLRDEGFLKLPEIRRRGPRGPRRVTPTALSEPRADIGGAVADIGPLTLTVVGPDESALWRELIQRHHYLGYRAPFGATLRYLVRPSAAPERILACLLWTSPAWKMGIRDRWIGWSAEQRARNLQRIVNNARFLILPWVRVPGLASTILSRCARQLPLDWERLYGYQPLLLETLVDTTRFRGTCYRAANWIALGETRGRGRMDRHRTVIPAPKLLFVYPLRRRVERRLCDGPSRSGHAILGRDATLQAD